MKKRNSLEIKFDTFLKLIGKQRGFEQGQWNLDYASCYGGYVIVEFMENGGEHHPLITRRLKRSEMEVAIEMSIEVKRITP